MRDGRKRRRAPGGGRKPLGPFAGKTEPLTTRITAETRQALEEGARLRGVSLSQYVEMLLCRGVGMKMQMERKLERLLEVGR